MSAKKLTAEDVRQRIRAAISAYGDQTQLGWAKAHGVSPTYLSEVLTGVRTPGKRVLEPLGLKAAEPTFEENRGPSDEA